MDVDAFADRRRADWERLDTLLRRRRWSPEEADEALDLYRAVATDLSRARSGAPDPALVSRLSSLVGRARARVLGAPAWSWRTGVRFVTDEFPAALAASARWWVTTALACVALAVLIGAWVAGNPDVAAALVPPDETRRLVEEDFAAYYSSNPASSFAAQVWTNNVRVAAACLLLGVLLVPVPAVLLLNVANVGAIGGIMAANGRLDLFLGLITPHGLLELTAVFVAGGAGLRLGWSWIAPGARSRAQALAEEGRTTVGIALGLVGVLLISGVIEAFVTPSGLPTWARIGIGVAAELAFVAYVWRGHRIRRHRAADPDGLPQSLPRALSAR